MSARSTAIVAAMAEELIPVLRRLRGTSRERCGGLRVTRGVFDDEPVVVVSTGEGEVAAQSGVSALLEQGLADRMVIIGVSGGLCPTLAPGSLIAGRRVLRDGVAAPAPDPALHAAALRVPEVRDGTLISSGQILCTPESKAVAFRDVEGGGPAAVDLETFGYATAAGRHGVPWVAVRAICDTADEELPLDFNRFVGDDGRIRRERVALHAMRHPSLIPGLRHMQERLSLCARRLEQFVGAFVHAAHEVEE